MTVSPALSAFIRIERLLGRFRSPLPADQAARAPDALAAKDAERPPGALVWLMADTVADAAALAEPADRLMQSDRLGAVLLTGPALALTIDNELGAGVITAPPPAPQAAAIARFLDYWRPDLCVLTGSPLQPALVGALASRGIPVFMVAGRVTPAQYQRWRWLRPVARAILSHFSLLLTEDWRSARDLRRLGAAETLVELSGGFEAASVPLPCAEAERDALAKLLRTRPVWLAAGAVLAEVPALIDAQKEASRLAHRLLLILAPDRADDAASIAGMVETAGLRVAMRSRDEDPEEDIQVYVADTDGELGLWYRLAPVTFLGGSLSGIGPTRDPFEPAGLGSAILHGPQSGDWARRMARLADGRAARSVVTPADLAEAVGDLIAPDRAAHLAHNSWQVVTGGAELADRLVSQMLARIPPDPFPIMGRGE